MLNYVSVNRPIIIKRGWDGETETNQVTCYFGEWAVFKFPLANGTEAELRMPIDEALEEGLIVSTDQIVFDPEDDYDDFEEESLGDND